MVTPAPVAEALTAILACKRCSHRLTQGPLIDTVFTESVDILWLGLSAKISKSLFDRPLDDATSSGKVIANIESACSGLKFYRSNALKCPPLVGSKLRYPTADELTICWPNTLLEIEVVRPKCVLLLGRIVAEHLESILGTKLPPPTEEMHVTFTFSPALNAFVAWLPHPSYLKVYRHAYLADFTARLAEKLQSICRGPNNSQV